MPKHRTEGCDLTVSQSAGDLRHWCTHRQQLQRTHQQRLLTPNLNAARTARLLDQLSPLFDDGTLQAPRVQQTIAPNQAIETYQQMADGGGGRHVIIPLDKQC